MGDVSLIWNSETQTSDTDAKNGDLVSGEDLHSAVVISLFSWRRAKDDDVLPDDEGGRKGWWADQFSDDEGDQIGSRIWLLSRAKITSETLAQLKEYAEEAVQWFVTDKIASSIEVRVERHELSRVDLIIVIYRSNGQISTLRFDDIWKVIENAQN